MKKWDFITAAKGTHRGFPNFLPFTLWLLFIGNWSSSSAQAALSGSVVTWGNTAYGLGIVPITAQSDVVAITQREVITP